MALDNQYVEARDRLRETMRVGRASLRELIAELDALEQSKTGQLPDDDQPLLFALTARREIQGLLNHADVIEQTIEVDGYADVDETNKLNSEFRQHAKKLCERFETK